MVKAFPCGGVESCLNLTSLGEKTMRDLVSFTLHKLAHQYAKNTTHEAIRQSQPVQVDRLVSYPLVLFI